MNTARNPAHIAPPYKNRYSHAIEVSAGMYNLTEILKSGGMDWNDVVKFSGFLTPQGDITTFAEVRQKFFGPQKPAMTVVWVPALVDPRWMLEVDLVAAR